MTWPTLNSDRDLILIPLTHEVVARRLVSVNFLIDGITYPESWPGDLLPLFPLWAEHPDAPTGQWTIIDGTTAVGAIGLKSGLDVTRPEIGYGINPEAQSRGIATAAVAALTQWLLGREVAKAVVAETAVSNRASQRVLTKCGYTHISSRIDETDGELMVWEHRSPLAASSDAASA